MSDTATALDQLRLAIQRDASLQERLFALQDAEAFMPALARLGEELGHAIPEDALAEALRQGRRAWIERDLPW